MIGIGIGLGVSHLRRGATSAFNPASLFASGEAGGWYDPSDISTLFQDTAGTTPVTAAGQSVARINDKSGRGLHLTQATAAAMPTYQVDANGRPYLNFDGVDDRLFTASVPTGATQSVGIGILSTGASDRTPWAVTVASADRLSIKDGTAGIIAGHYAGAVYISKSGAAVAAAHISLSEIVKNSTTDLRVNGVAQVGTTSPSAGATVGTSMGATTAALAFFAGRIYGLVHVARALTTGERTGLEAWLAGKTGVAL